MCSQSRLDLFFGFRVHLTIYHEQLNLIEKLCLTLLGGNNFAFRAVPPSPFELREWAWGRATTGHTTALPIAAMMARAPEDPPLTVHHSPGRRSRRAYALVPAVAQVRGIV